MPVVSVCIPAYNNEKYIEEVVESVLNQTYTDYEIIIVDDHSKDQTWKNIKKYNRSNVSIYQNKTNLGLVGNWNEAVAHASGKYIKLLCGDDILLPKCLEKEVEVLECNESVSMVISDLLIINSNGQLKYKVKRFITEGIKEGKMLARRSIHIKNYFGAPCNVLFRKADFDRLGGFADYLRYIPDFDMWLKLAYLGDIYYIKEYLSKFRVHEVSNTNRLITSNQNDYNKDHLKLINKHKELGKISITRGDILCHKNIRRIRNFMLAVFLRCSKYIKLK